MKLYHVSYFPVKEFIPRVPKYKLTGEDDKVPRICCSTSIEKCILAKPSRTDYLNLCDKYKIPCVIYLYTFEVNPDNPDVIPPKSLVDDYGVKDALETNEYWLCNRVPDYEETVCIVTGITREGDRLLKVHLSTEVEESDLIFVHLFEHFQDDGEEGAFPDEVLPRIWNDLMEWYKKERMNKKEGDKSYPEG